MKRSEYVGEALRAPEHRIRGLLVDGKMRMVTKVKGAGTRRQFQFDLTKGWRSYLDLVRQYRGVVLLVPNDVPRLLITFKSKFPACPQCGAVVPAHGFWDHYNALHATRAWWLNEEDWKSFLKGGYRKPPEFD